VRGFLETVTGKGLSGLARSGVICLGLGLTVAGYAHGTAARSGIARRQGWEPAKANGASAQVAEKA
jgi:hypothetical protein